MGRNVIELYKGLARDLLTLIGPVRWSAEINLRLERITHLLSLLDNPHYAYPSIHVGGTSGKGSTATMIATILSEAGYKTGLHLSPHLQILNERHQINNVVASTTRLVELYSEIKPAIAKVAAENPFGAPSYFEAQVALAFYYFQREAVDVAVIEVGLGGRIDATNVLNAAVAVLTNVGLDHTEILGDTIEAIIKDKAGIIKPGQKVISGVKQPTARQIVAQRCRRQHAELWQLEQAFHYKVEGERHFTVSMPSRTYDELEIGMSGVFQIANAACAVAAIEILPGFDVSETALRKGLMQAHVPGRMEIVQNDPVVILDGAHNPEKMKAAYKAVKNHYRSRRCLVVLSLKSDKAAEDILPPVIDLAETLFITKFHVKGLWNPYDPAELAALAKEIAPDLDVRIVPEPIVAVQQALAEAEPDDLVLVTGSLYLVGDIRQHWYPIDELITQAEKGLKGSLTP